MKKYIIYLVLLVFIISCSKKIYDHEIKEINAIGESKDKRNIKYLSGKVYSLPKPKKFYSAILLLYYNDSIKIYAGSDFDGNFSFYDFKPELINEKSYLYAVNKGCIPKKIFFDSLKKPIRINLIRDSINGISYDEYINILSKNRQID